MTRRPFTPLGVTHWTQILTGTLDLIALGVLAKTSEIHPAPFVLVAFILVVSRLRRVPFSQGFLVSCFGFILVGALSSWFLGLGPVHPIVTASYAAPLCHALLWLAKDTPRNRGWRVGMGFIELILASSLTSEIYLSLSIIVFIVTSSVALSCNFLDQELSTRSPNLLKSPLPQGFIRKSLGLAFLIFLTSALIFPLLPRMRIGSGLHVGNPTIGYTENVNLSEWGIIKQDRGGKTMLRIYPSSTGTDLSFEILHGLIRGRVLDHFDGKSWKPSRQQPSRKISSKPPLKSETAKRERISIEIVREPMESEVLPSPYGTRALWLMENENLYEIRTNKNAEWISHGSTDRRLHYTLQLLPNDLSELKETAKNDSPQNYLLEVSDSIKTDRIQKLAKRLFIKPKSEREKIQSVLSYFRNEKFTVAESTSDLASLGLKSRLSPLETFLFISKQGHCEWFASSLALLLRMGGVPSRLIAGFRITRSPFGGVLTVRSGDAHAWVEAWIPDYGWTPIDPTPRLVGSSSWFEVINQSYDWISSYWYRYVVTYGDRGDSSLGIQTFRSLDLGLRFTKTLAQLKTFKERHRELFMKIGGTLFALFSVLGLVAWFWFPWVFSIRWRVRLGPAILRRERLRLERLFPYRLLSVREKERSEDLEDLIRWVQKKYGEEIGADVGVWKERYLRARFGPSIGDLKTDARFLKEKIREISAKIKSAA